jgi:hypothetical protein
MSDETKTGVGFDAMRVVINLGGVVLAVGVIVLIVATITTG